MFLYGKTSFQIPGTSYHFFFLSKEVCFLILKNGPTTQLDHTN